uniref:Innexin n=1 Tax=Plectus sambesii TaxID=2011161 RepID=A0A914X929_9BILA
MVLEVMMGMASYLSVRRDDDWTDRMHYFITANLLISLSILVSFKQFGGQPIECMFPNAFPDSWEQYAENYCWSQDTYFVAPDEHVANVDVFDRDAPERKLSYYQWVPFFLLLEAACFRLPSLIWKYLAGHSGIRIHEIVKLAMDPNNINPEVKKNNIAALTVHLQNALRFQRRIDRKGVKPHKIMRALNLPYSAYFVTTMYLVTKLFYLLNVIFQLHAMNKFLETDKYNWYGFGVIRDILNGTQWEKSGVFPRVSICDFEVRQVANIQKYSVQCVLVINIFNEKIFILLWFWYMALMVVTVFSFFYWFLIMVMPWFGRWFISRNLELSEMPFDPHGSKPEVNRFVDRYLRSDGVFVLRMITMHAGIIFGTDLVLALWKTFYGVEEQLRKGHSGDIPIKSDNANNVLRLRKKGKKDKDLDDSDALVAGFMAKKAHDTDSSQSTDEEDEKTKQARTLFQPSLSKTPPPTASTKMSKPRTNGKTIKEDDGSLSAVQL